MDKYNEIVSMWRGWHIASVSDIDERLHNFRILFAYNSGKIENECITYHDTLEIFENGRTLNFTGDPRALFELNNQKLCYELLKHKIAAREPITVQLVLETHAALTGGTYDEKRYVERGERPGAFKTHDYVTGRMEVGSMPEDVSVDISALLDEISNYSTENYANENHTIKNYANDNILKTAAYFHLRFEYIHPFADGNGRVGRTLLNYFLMICDHPPIIIYDEDKSAYYAALEAYDENEDISPMHKLLRWQTERTWEKTIERERRRAAEVLATEKDVIECELE